METTSGSRSPVSCREFIFSTTCFGTCSEFFKRLSVARLHDLVSYFVHRTSCNAVSGSLDALQDSVSGHGNGNSHVDGPAGRLGTAWCTPKFLDSGEVGDEVREAGCSALRIAPRAHARRWRSAERRRDEPVSPFVSRSRKHEETSGPRALGSSSLAGVRKSGGPGVRHSLGMQTHPEVVAVADPRTPGPPDPRLDESRTPPLSCTRDRHLALLLLRLLLLRLSPGGP